MRTDTYEELIKNKWYDKENNVSIFYNKDEFYPKSEKRNNWCILRYHLVRIKHVETFSTVYLLQVILRYVMHFPIHIICNKDWKVFTLQFFESFL